MIYGSEACGYNTFTKCNQIQYRVVQFFIRVHKYELCCNIQQVHKEIWDGFYFVNRCIMVHYGIYILWDIYIDSGIGLAKICFYEFINSQKEIGYFI